MQSKKRIPTIVEQKKGDNLPLSLDLCGPEIG